MKTPNIVDFASGDGIMDALTQLLRAGAQRGYNYLAKVVTGVKFKDGIEATETG